MKNMKVAIIGSGDVGATCAQRIAEAGLADVVLVDILEGKAEGKALDLSSAASIIGHSRCISGSADFKNIAGADIVISTCGQTRSPGQSREDLLSNNAKIIKEVSLKIAQYCPDAIVVVVTNPVDVMSYLTFKITGFSANRIIGMGGTSDCARFNMLVGAELNTDSRNIQSVIVGAHADNMVILPRLSTAKGKPITDLLPQDKIATIVDETRNFGARIVGLLGQGSAYFGPSAGTFLVVDSIINNRKNRLCASAYLCGQYGLQDLFVGVPLKIGKDGAEQIVELDLTEEEKKDFLASAKSIKESIKKLGV
jgi:malate dehydrogenase